MLVLNSFFHCYLLSVLPLFEGISVGAALQIRAGQWLITASLWPLTTHLYHVMIAVMGGVSKKPFLFLRNSFEQSRTYFLGI